jgi:S1-C subfamily serine protease
MLTLKFPEIALMAALLAGVGRAEDAGPVPMKPYVVSESPFGYLGIRHASLEVDGWKFVTGRNSIKFLQVDELDPASSAVSQGVRAGDRIIALNGVPMSGWALMPLRRLGQELTVGQKVAAVMFRPSEKKTWTVEFVVMRKPARAAPPR